MEQGFAERMEHLRPGQWWWNGKTGWCMAQPCGAPAPGARLALDRHLKELSEAMETLGMGKPLVLLLAATGKESAAERARLAHSGLGLEAEALTLHKFLASPDRGAGPVLAIAGTVEMFRRDEVAEFSRWAAGRPGPTLAAWRSDPLMMGFFGGGGSDLPGAKAAMELAAEFEALNAAASAGRGRAARRRV